MKGRKKRGRIKRPILGSLVGFFYGIGKRMSVQTDVNEEQDETLGQIKTSLRILKGGVRMF